jgi:coupling of ubiquitin conjugation to ER degradation protein 1
MATKEDTPILPQAAAFLVISYLVYRFFFAGSPSSSDGASGNAGRVVDPRRLQQQVEVVRGMFPQFSQAAVEAELIRNGGSIEMATERILSTGFLPEVSLKFSTCLQSY